VLQDEGQNLNHFLVAAGTLEKLALQEPEGLGQVNEGRAIAQSAGLALDYRQIMAPVINRSSRLMMRTLDDPRMFAQDLPFSRNDDPLRVNPNADRPIGERGRHAVAVALQVNET